MLDAPRLPARRINDVSFLGRVVRVRLHEKGGKRHEVPAHHNAEAYLDAYLESSGISSDKKGPLFRSFNRKGELTEKYDEPA